MGTLETNGAMAPGPLLLLVGVCAAVRIPLQQAPAPEAPHHTAWRRDRGLALAGVPASAYMALLSVGTPPQNFSVLVRARPGRC